MDCIIHNAYEILLKGRVSMWERYGLKSSYVEGGERSVGLPLHSSDSPCEIKLDLMVQYEAERESLEILYDMWDGLQFCVKLIQRLEAVLTANAIPIPEYDDGFLALPAGWRFFYGGLAEILCTYGRLAPIYAGR